MDQPDNDFQTLAKACENVVPAELWLQHRAVVAVSGGADSVALFRTLVHIQNLNCSADRLGPKPAKLIVAHVDHAVRGEDSAADQDFVEQLAGQFDAEFVSIKLDAKELMGDRESVSEETMRDARYNCLRKIAQDRNARYLYTGHHLNDQAETILFRIFRGTGLAGLKGIPAIRRDDWLTIVRPFLKVPKSVLLAALDSLDQPFCTDATNLTNDYGRNFIRNDILKSAKDYFGLPIEEAIARLADHAGDAEEIQNERVDYFYSQSPPEKIPNGVLLNSDSLSKQSCAIIRSILIRIWQQQQWSVSQMSYERWQQMAEQIRSATVATTFVENLPGNIRFEVTGKFVRITA